MLCEHLEFLHNNLNNLSFAVFFCLLFFDPLKTSNKNNFRWMQEQLLRSFELFRFANLEVLKETCIFRIHSQFWYHRIFLTECQFLVENVLNCQLFHLISLHSRMYNMSVVKRRFCAQLIESLKLSQAKQIYGLLSQFWLYRHNHMNGYSIVYK